MNVAGKVLLWIAYIPAMIVVDLVGFLFAPIFVMLADRTGFLPAWLAWWQTSDNPIDGDNGHLKRWAGSSIYVRRLAWLWRNNGYGFAQSVLRARSSGPVTLRGDPAVSNRPLVEGLVIRTTPEGHWQLYYIRAYTSKLCVRINLGWKLWGDVSHQNFGMFVITPAPAMAYERSS